MQVLIMEEASRLDENVFKEVILPLTAVNDTVLLGISTPLDESNFYSVMLEMKRPNGEPLFNVLQITTICDVCLKEGRLTCAHKGNELPAWKSGERQELIASLMSNDRALYVQENLGVIVKRDASAFDKASLDRFAAPSSWYTMSGASMPRFLYVCVDPAGGGPSGLAAVACFFTTAGHLVICGAESGVVTNDAAQERFMHSFLAQLRDVVLLQGAHIVLIIERNFGGSVLASRIAGVCAGFAPISSMSQDSNGKLRRIGIVLCGEVKSKMRNSLSIMLRAGVVHLSHEFVGSRDEVVMQLRNYRFEDIAPKKGSFAPAKRILTGKGAGKNDDLAICVQMCSFWPGTHQSDGGKCLVDCAA